MAVIVLLLLTALDPRGASGRRKSALKGNLGFYFEIPKDDGDVVPEQTEPTAPPPPPPAPRPPPPRLCPRAAAVAAALSALDLDGSECPTIALERRMFAISPSIDKLFVNIGCNKGYNVAAFLGLWAPQTGVHSGHIWQEALASFITLEGSAQAPCGFCSQCQEVYSTPLEPGSARNPETEPGKQQPHMFCVEAVPATARVLQRTVDALNVSSYVTVLNAAFGLPAEAGEDPTSRMATFPNCSAGNEICALDHEEEAIGKPVDVPFWAVDDWLAVQEKAGIIKPGQELDSLHIDVEGHDPSVLKGASNTLKSGRVAVVEFEYNDRGTWSGTSLKAVVDELDGYGMDCYRLSGSPRTWALSGCAWNETFDGRGGNVFCARRGHPWWMLAESWKVVDPLDVAAPAPA